MILIEWNRLYQNLAGNIWNNMPVYSEIIAVSQSICLQNRVRSIGFLYGRRNSNAAVVLLPRPHTLGWAGLMQGHSRFSLVKVSDAPANRVIFLLRMGGDSSILNPLKGTVGLKAVSLERCEWLGICPLSGAKFSVNR